MTTKEDIERLNALFQKEYWEWTDDDLVWVLKNRYTSQPIPPCEECGAERTCQSMGGGRASVYACDGRIPDPNDPERLIFAEGRTIADKHYSRSRWEQRQMGDHAVLEALKRWENAAEQAMDS